MPKGITLTLEAPLVILWHTFLYEHRSTAGNAAAYVRDHGPRRGLALVVRRPPGVPGIVSKTDSPKSES